MTITMCGDKHWEISIPVGQKHLGSGDVCLTGNDGVGRARWSTVAELGIQFRVAMFKAKLI